MEDLESFWSFQESFEVDELNQKLQLRNYELEFVKKESSEVLRKNNEYIKQLFQLLQKTCKERDETKAQLKKLKQIITLNVANMKTQPSIIPSSNSDIKKTFNVVSDHNIPTNTFPTTPFSPDTPLSITNNFPTKTNSNVTESSSFSLETQTTNNNSNNVNNPHSRISSPVMDSLSSPDSNNVVNFCTKTTPSMKGLVDRELLIQPQQTSMISQKWGKIDHESVIIANLAKGRSLPNKGKLLQAVLEAGPLLSTLMVAGSLPQWRNPPGSLTRQIPPVNLKGSIGLGLDLGPNSNLGVGTLSHNKQDGIQQPIINSKSSSSYLDRIMPIGDVTSNGSIGICPSSMLDFGSGSCFIGGRMMLNSGVNLDCQISKRQRII